MTKRKTAASHSPEVRGRAVRMVPDGAGEHGSRWAAIGSAAAKIGCTVARMMRRMGLRGIVRGKETRTTVPDKAPPCPADRVNRRCR